MKAYINLITEEITKARPTDPHILLDMEVEEVEDGRDEWDRSVTIILNVPRGTYLHLGLAPQEPAPTVN